MSGYKIAKVVATNFGPFETAEVDFSLAGLTLVEGIIEGMPGSDSNGAGKSFLFEMPIWAMYGRCLRPGYDGDEVIRLGAKQGAMVRVELPGDHDTVSIIRYRKDPTQRDRFRLFVDGTEITRGTNAQTQLAFEQIVGMDFLSATNCVAFGARADVKSFFAAADADRKRIMEKILGLELYGEAEKIARRRLADSAVALQRLEEKRLSLMAVGAEQRQMLTSVLTSEEVEHLRFQLKEQTVRVKQRRRALLAAEKAVEEAEADVVEESHKREAKLNDYEARCAARSRVVEALEAGKEQLIGTLAKANAVASSLQAGVRASTALSGATCPTCKQVVDAGHVASHVFGLKDGLATATATAKEAQVKLVEVREAIGAVPGVPPFGHTGYDAATELLEKAEEVSAAALSTLKAEEARLSAMQADEARVATQAREVQDRIAATEKQLVAAEAEYGALKLAADRLQFWIEGFGNQGLKSFLIEAEIPAINKLATRYAQGLLCSGTTIQLKATKELKTSKMVREQMTVDAKIPGYTDSYAGASTGQKRRLDLALMLAFRDIVGARSARAFKQFFADELFDGVDRSGVETVIGLLREVSANCPVMLVTHDHRLKSAADRTITVHHCDGRAVLLARGAQTATSQTSTGPKKVTKRG